MDRRVGIGVGLFLGLLAKDSFQSVLPPLYGDAPLDERDVRRAAKFAGIEVLIVAFLAGAITKSPYPVLIVGGTIGAVYLAYMYETGNRHLQAIPADEGE